MFQVIRTSSSQLGLGFRIIDIAAVISRSSMIHAEACPLVAAHPPGRQLSALIHSMWLWRDCWLILSAERPRLPYLFILVSRGSRPRRNRRCHPRSSATLKELDRNAARWECKSRCNLHHVFLAVGIAFLVQCGV